MVPLWFVYIICALIVVTCGMLIPLEIMAAGRSIWRWLRLLWHQPSQALRSLWSEFWKSWGAVGTVATLLCTAALAPDMFGFGAAKICFVLGNVLFFVRLSIEDKLHGKKGNRKHGAQRAAITIFLLALFGFLSFLELGSVANREKGRSATAKNIWDAACWWRKQPTAIHSLEHTSETSTEPQKAPPDSDEHEFDNISNPRLEEMARDTAAQIKDFGEKWYEARTNQQLILDDLLRHDLTPQGKQQALKEYQTGLQGIADSYWFGLSGRKLFITADKLRKAILGRLSPWQKGYTADTTNEIEVRYLLSLTVAPDLDEKGILDTPEYLNVLARRLKEK